MAPLKNSIKGMLNNINSPDLKEAFNETNIVLALRQPKSIINQLSHSKYIA